jgi:hypothetical protein
MRSETTAFERLVSKAVPGLYSTACIVLITLSLTACSERGGEILRNASGPTCFAHALSREYLQVSYALESRGHLLRAAEYRRRAEDVSAGETANPIIDGWKASGELPVEIAAASDDFHGLANRQNAKDVAPFELAHAQGRLDCWGEFAIRENISEVARQCQADFVVTACYLHSALGGPGQCSAYSGVTLQPISPPPPHAWQC